MALRILHVVVNMNRGGAETVIMNLYRNIDRSKIQFDFLTCKEGVFDSEIEALGGRVFRIPYLTDVGHFNYMKELNRFFINHPKYNIVHSHMDKMSGFVLRAAKKAGIPYRISHSHNTSSEGNLAARSYKWYSGRMITRCASDLFACSSEASKWLFGNRSEEASILKNGIDYEQFKYSGSARKEMRVQLGIGEQDIVVGHVGRFFRQKNHSFLIDIFAALLKKNPNGVLLLVGEGPLKNEVIKKAEYLGFIDQVRLLGVRGDVPKLLQAFDVMVFPSMHEGLGLSLIEAQATGLPCVISDIIPEEVDLGAGLITYLSLEHSPEEWAEQILKKIAADRNRHMQRLNKSYDIQESADWLQNYYLEKGAL